MPSQAVLSYSQEEAGRDQWPRFWLMLLAAAIGLGRGWLLLQDVPVLWPVSLHGPDGLSLGERVTWTLYIISHAGLAAGGCLWLAATAILVLCKVGWARAAVFYSAPIVAFLMIADKLLQYAVDIADSRVISAAYPYGTVSWGVLLGDANALARMVLPVVLAGWCCSPPRLRARWENGTFVLRRTCLWIIGATPFLVAYVVLVSIPGGGTFRQFMRDIAELFHSTDARTIMERLAWEIAPKTIDYAGILMAVAAAGCLFHLKIARRVVIGAAWAGLGAAAMYGLIQTASQILESAGVFPDPLGMARMAGFDGALNGILLTLITATVLGAIPACALIVMSLPQVKAAFIPAKSIAGDVPTPLPAAHAAEPLSS
jgi:hypothetical protein